MSGPPETVKVQIDGKPAAYIHALVATGLYGDTPEEVGEHLVMQALREILGAGLLPFPTAEPASERLRLDDDDTSLHRLL